MTRIRPAATVLFVLLACGLAWLVVLPLWLDGGLSNPLSVVLLPVMMYTPAIAVLIVVLVARPVPKGERLRALGLWPLRPLKRTIALSLIGLFGPILVVVLSVAIAAFFGWVTLDLEEFSGFAALLAQSVPAGVDLPPTGILLLAQVVSMPIAAATVNALFAFGEELGWRGFLIPALRPLGTWPTLLLSGVIWGLWHAPVILLGYNFGRTDVSGVLFMVGGCVAWGVLLGWLRLRSASVWPAVFAHGALNASAGLIGVLFAAGTTYDMAFAGPLGVAGWIACAIVIVVLLLAGQFRGQPALAGAGRPRDQR